MCLGLAFVAEAQIPATVTLAAGARQDEKQIQVSWMRSDETNWHVQYDGRLDIMSIRTQIGRQILTPNPKFTSRFTLAFDHPCQIECLINVVRAQAGETISLQNKQTGKLICNLLPKGKSEFMTPAFNPAEAEIVWAGYTGSLPSSEITIQNIYYQPADPSREFAIGFGTALPCHPNAVCKTDSMARLISNSDVRIRLVNDEGIGWCSGALVNTARNDKTPFLLSAYHCTYDLTPKFDMWRFDFEYTSATCANPAVEPTFVSLTGCELKASGQASDFILLLLTDSIPSDLQATFAGWNRNDTAVPDTTYLIHHPNADIRKYSTCSNPATIHPNQIGWAEGYTTPAFHHFRIKFTEGGHEKGSSGGPVFNQDFQLIGQLHGGTSGCEAVNNAYVGRLAKSWNLGTAPYQRLRDWLDPDATGVMSIPSLENISASDMVTLHGLITDPLGRPVKNVTVELTGAASMSVVTDDQGRFELTPVNRNGHYSLVPKKDSNPSNGLNAFDLLSIQKHLLAKDTFDFPWQHIAADATNNVDITVGDQLVLLKLLLGKIAYLPSSPSWRFLPLKVELNGLPAGQQNDILITGIKIGDVNATSNPSQ